MVMFQKCYINQVMLLLAVEEVVRLELDDAKFGQILMELEVLHKCRSPYIVYFYGAFFVEGMVYMCIEYMDNGSLDRIYDQRTLRLEVSMNHNWYTLQTQ